MSSLAATMATRQEHARAHKRAVSQTSADTRAQMPRGTRRCRHFVANRAGVSWLALCVSRVTSALEQQKLARAWSTPNEQRHEVNKRTVADVPYIGACGDGLVCVCKSPRKLGKCRRLFADVGVPMYMHVCAYAHVSLPTAMCTQTFQSAAPAN